jgi:hypothetical protein
MNNEQQQIIDEVYKKHINSLFYDFSGEVKGYLLHEHLSKEEFIDKCKTNPEFSEKWGLKIEERELSREERIDLYAKEYTPGMRNKYEPPFDDFIDAKLSVRNIPTKLITITYNNKTIESYEYNR